MADPRRAQVGDPSTDPHADTHSPHPASGTRVAESEADPRLGTTLAHFRLDAPLGRGGMGAVYRGWDTALERPVAVKILTIDHPEARERFLREARAQARVRHPNVVPIHFVGEQGDTVFLSMDLIEGPSMADRLDAGSVSVDEALDVVDAVALALEEGRRRGLVHRDVKPSNVLCADDGRVLLADFGLAKAVGDADEPTSSDPAPQGAALTQHGAIVGTAAYMAPEQTRGGAIDHRADMYALGVTLYEMVVGQRPFTAPDVHTLLHQHREEEPMPPRSLKPELRPEVEALVTRLMKKDPEARFGEYVALREAVAAARVRVAPPAGVFTRSAAELVDLIVGGFMAALLSEVLSGAVVWFPAVILWAIAESRWGKTLGKRLFAMRVIGAHDRPPRFLQALWRNLLKHWGLVVTAIVNATLPESGLRNLIGIVVVLAWGLGLAIAFRSDKRAAHDHLSRTRVAYDLG